MTKSKNFMKNYTIINILLIGSLIIGVILFSFITFRKPGYTNVRLKVGEESVTSTPWDKEIGVSDWYAAQFVVGMKDQNEVGFVGAEIMSITSYDIAPGRKALFLDLKLQSVFNRSSNRFTYNGSPLLVGKTLKVRLGGVDVNGLITGMDGVVDPRKKTSFIVEANLLTSDDPQIFFPSQIKGSFVFGGVDKAVYDNIQKGDTVKDKDGNTIVEILAKSGRLVGNKRTDLFLSLRVNGYIMDGRYYIFDDYPILIGEEIPLNFRVLSVFPRVTAIRDISSEQSY